MRKLLTLIALVALPCFAAEMPVWMAGSWHLDSPQARVEEHWTTADGGLMLGMSKTVNADGRIQFEFLRVADQNGKPAYLAMPSARPATTFEFKSADTNRIVFENLKHDFPQRIIYWRDGEKLCARIEGMMHGKVEGEEWCYQRQ